MGWGHLCRVTTMGIKRETDRKQGDVQALELNKLLKHKSKRGGLGRGGLLSGVLRHPGYLQKQVCLGGGWVVAGRCCGVDLGCSPGI